MTKKTIILVLITLLVINTIFWLYIGIRVYKLISLNKHMDVIEEMPRLEGKYRLKAVKNYFEMRDKITDGFGGSIVEIFEDTYPYTPFIILAIIDVVLIAIAFMIILLYKKD
ncbi:hypothetical protein ES702_01270 [subsurface metagenome]